MGALILKTFIQTIVISITLLMGASKLFGQSALFLLISPGTASNGMGEVGVASHSLKPEFLHYNPASAGLSLRPGIQYSHSAHHCQWLPGLVDDMGFTNRSNLMGLGFTPNFTE